MAEFNSAQKLTVRQGIEEFENNMKVKVNEYLKVYHYL